MSTNAIETVDLLVVGGGKAGKSLAMERAKAGWKVAMVERRFVGGTCINVACIPTKSLVNSARRLSDARTDEAFGIVGTEGARVDLAKLRAHKEGIVGAMVGAHEKMFAAPGLDFIRGEARFTGERTVTIALVRSAASASSSTWARVRRAPRSPACGSPAPGRTRKSCASRSCPPRWRSSVPATSAWSSRR